MDKVSETLEALAVEIASRKDSEVEGFAFVLPQYLTDHKDKAAYRDIDRQVNALARAHDRMVKVLEKAAAAVRKIEQSVDSFYGE